MELSPTPIEPAISAFMILLVLGVIVWAIRDHMMARRALQERHRRQSAKFDTLWGLRTDVRVLEEIAAADPTNEAIQKSLRWSRIQVAFHEMSDA